MSATAVGQQPTLKARSLRRVTGEPSGDQRIVFRGVEWDLYDRLTEAVGQDQHIRVAFDGKDMEIMTTGRLHEDYKGLFGRFVGAPTFELRVHAATPVRRPGSAR